MKTAQIGVQLVDHMGTDLTVVNAARVSFDKESEWEDASEHWERSGTRSQLKSSDAKLIAYLAKHNHWSPFAHTSVQLRVKAPIFVARQLVKHQVGGVWNEVSRRYVDSEPEFYIPHAWRKRAVNAKQGSSDQFVVSFGENDGGHGEAIEEAVFGAVTVALALYEEMLEDGIAPEMARMVLPQNMMTEWYWTGSLVFWARVCKLRLDPHSQAETTDVAQRINGLIAPLFPVAWKELMA